VGFTTGAEGLIIVNAWTLSEAPKNPTGFVALEGAICLELVLEHPLASHHIGLRRPWNEIPSVVGKKCRELLLHSCTPIGVGESNAVSPRDGRQWYHLKD
jgi:hypothetical protein